MRTPPYRCSRLFYMQVIRLSLSQTHWLHETSILAQTFYQRPENVTRPRPGNIVPSPRDPQVTRAPRPAPHRPRLPRTLPRLPRASPSGSPPSPTLPHPPAAPPPPPRLPGLRSPFHPCKVTDSGQRMRAKRRFERIFPSKGVQSDGFRTHPVPPCPTGSGRRAGS